jgi:hypothetical protein
VRTLKKLLLLPYHLFMLVVFGETPEDRKSHDQQVAEREAQKRVERHGTP